MKRNKQGESLRFWERVSGLYHLLIRKDEKAYDAMVEQMRDCLQKDWQVLEIGAGPGNVSSKIAASCGSLVATDAAEGMVRQAKKALAGVENVQVMQADVQNLCFEEGAFDAVVMVNVLHILPDPRAALKECARVLKPQGLLIAPTFLWDKSLSGRIKARMREVSGFKAYSKWGFDELVCFFEEEGWTIREARVFPSGVEIGYIEAIKG